MRVCCHSISIVVFVSLCVIQSSSHVHAEPAKHFIAAFDRFGKHDEIDEALTRELLITELSCTACHQSDEEALVAKGGPNLEGAGTRLSAEWLHDYLINPQGVKPGTTMPDVLHGLSDAEKEKVAVALTAFLSTQQSPFPQLKATGLIPVTHEFWLKGSVEEGGKLYHSVGCVACHAPDSDFETAGSTSSALDRLIEQLDPEELKELGLSGAARTVNSIPHGDLNKKYTLLSLSHFLHNPDRDRPSGRMPNLKLLPSEAADIAAYLLRSQKKSAASIVPSQDAQLIAEGKKYFMELRCVNCHNIKGIESNPAKTPLANLNLKSEQSCFTNSTMKQPAYVLSEEQITKLVADSDKSESQATASHHDLRMLQLNCFACHERDTLGGVGRKRQQYFETVGHVDIGDEGRLPPSLTHVGKKLTPSWFARVLDGKGDIRPHMTIRMPIFSKALTRQLPKQIAIADEVNAASEKEVFGDLANLAQPGRQLLNTGCIQCHPLRGESLASVVGTDLNGVHNRVRPAWFKEFLRNPIDLKQRTRMPTFFPNGVSSNPDILAGDVDQQIAAIWAYLKENGKHPLPEKILEARSKSFELVPTDKPIVLRTFMGKAGMHAIAVGFPEKIHFAFDAETCQLVEAWKGRFLDAHGTWFDRFTPLAEPLGTNRIDFHNSLSYGNSKPGGGSTDVLQHFGKLIKKDFVGYQLDQAGIPTFRYKMGGYLIEERIVPAKSGELHRQFVIKSSAEETTVETSKVVFLFKLLTGKKIEKVDDKTFVNESGLTVKLPANSPLTPYVMHTPERPLENFCLSTIHSQPERIEFEVVYKW
ncbi:Cytochrome c [Thalassoglobus polymorphus]|uniref:Cytochrome c n=1 Tax=Thalassoglobus polymorphus TaxID=2527994 RepID=A0A517QL54_9PLAN|nr:Cytochrome c [Thalassoglobus polymorphus]